MYKIRYEIMKHSKSGLSIKTHAKDSKKVLKSIVRALNKEFDGLIQFEIIKCDPKGITFRHPKINQIVSVPAYGKGKVVNFKDRFPDCWIEVEVFENKKVIRYDPKEVKFTNVVLK